MIFFKKDVFGHILFIKKWLIRFFGLISHPGYRGFNNLQITGSDVIRELPQKNVLFISNHQTYYADVTAMFHVFNASLRGRQNSISNIGYMWNPKLNIYYVAAKETLTAGFFPRILSYMGAIPVQRTWRAEGKDIAEKRAVNPDDTLNIMKALEDGWVITFPQGTTKSFKPIRRGTAHIIKQYKPIVVPVVIDGFRRSFDKKGLYLKKTNILQTMVIKDPLKIDYENDTVDEIVTKIEFAIEQHSSLLKVIPVEILTQEKELNRKRNFGY
ncbi:MAG: lysophospholipid acyltransferase family protein [Flavobacterium sp.]